MYGFLFAFFVAGPILGTIFYWLYSGTRAIAEGPASQPYDQQAAGRIHLFEGDRYYNSSPDNAYEHDALDWSGGRLGCAMSSELMEYPQYQPALIGTIQLLKPEYEKGMVAVILDNHKVAALGLEPVGLSNGAQRALERMIPRQSLHRR